MAPHRRRPGNEVQWLEDDVRRAVAAWRHQRVADVAVRRERQTLLRQIAKANPPIIDDFSLAPLTDRTVRDFLEILDDRYDRNSTLITSQLPVE